MSWFKSKVFESRDLDVIPQRKFRGRLSWPGGPREVGVYLVCQVTLDDKGFLIKDWLKDKTKFKKLLRMDGSGRIWLWKRIVDDQRKKGLALTDENGEVMYPNDSDTEMENT